MKFEVRGAINAELLAAELGVALGSGFRGVSIASDGAVTVHVADGDGLVERAREVVGDHNARGTTPRQKRVKALEREIASVRESVNFGAKAVPGVERFLGMSGEELARVVYLLWLEIEGGDPR